MLDAGRDESEDDLRRVGPVGRPPRLPLRGVAFGLVLLSPFWAAVIAALLIWLT